jgi:hypothetical protein
VSAERSLQQKFKRYPRVVLATMLAQLSVNPVGTHIPATLDELNEVYQDLRAGRVARIGVGHPDDDDPNCGVGKETHETSHEAEG